MSALKKLRELTTNFLKVLSDPIRLDILYLLEKNTLNAFEIQKKAGRSQSTISKHLNMLVENNLIDFEKRDNIKYYTIKNSEIFDIINNINAIILNNTKTRLREMQDADVQDVLS